MRAIPIVLALGLTFALQGAPAGAVVLLDTGLNTSTAALRADTSEHFTCGAHGCVQDYDLVTAQASMITLAQGGVASAFTFAASVPNDLAVISLFRATNSGKLLSDHAHLLWADLTGDSTSSIDLGQGIQELTFSGLSIALQPGAYWVEYQTVPTFTASDLLMAGNGFSRLAHRTVGIVTELDPTSGGPGGWGYSPDPKPQVSIRIDASSVFPAKAPEPAAWTLMIGGFGLAGAALRRRRAALTAG